MVEQGFDGVRHRRLACCAGERVVCETVSIHDKKKMTSPSRNAGACEPANHSLAHSTHRPVTAVQRDDDPPRDQPVRTRVCLRGDWVGGAWVV